MKIVHKYPPHWEQYKETFNLKGKRPLFPYGDTIYAPFTKREEIQQHIIVHEEVHQKQQGKDPDKWVEQYLQDPHFRLEQEITAYKAQYTFAKTELKPQYHKEFLKLLAIDLSSEMYGNLLTLEEALDTLSE